MTATLIDARPTAREVTDVHLEPDLQQEQDHPQLGEHLEHVGWCRRARATTDR